MVQQILITWNGVQNKMDNRGLYTEKRINWLVVFTIFATAYAFFRTPFEFYIFYIPILIIFPYFFRHFNLGKGYLWIILSLGIAGIFSVLTGTNTLDNFLKTYISIFFIYSFYYYAFAFNGFKVEKLFGLYVKFAYVVVWIGVFQFASALIGFTPGYNFKWFLNKWTLVFSEGLLRVNSIVSEPSQLAFVLAPVLFISIYNLMNNQVFMFSKKKAYLFIIISLLTFSTHAYIIILFSIAFILLRHISLPKTIILLVSLFFAFTYIYANFDLVRKRVDDSLLIVKEYDRIHDRVFLMRLNSSSFALLNNYVVAIESFKKNPVFGGGLGSHPESFDKYSLTKSVQLPFEDFNKADANSLFLRLTSETGLMGITIFLVLIFKFRFGDSSNMKRWIISHSILVMMIAGFLREGHYFHSGVPFFIFAYIFNYRQGQKEKEKQVQKRKILNTTDKHEVHINYGGSR